MYRDICPHKHRNRKRSPKSRSKAREEKKEETELGPVGQMAREDGTVLRSRRRPVNGMRKNEGGGSKRGQLGPISRCNLSTRRRRSRIFMLTICPAAYRDTHAPHTQAHTRLYRHLRLHKYIETSREIMSLQ